MDNGKWIWLDEKVYPDFMKCKKTIYDKENETRFCVAEFARALILNKPASSFQISVAAQSKFYLWVNKTYVGEGPVYAGGDNFSDLSPDKTYCSRFNVKPSGNKLNINILVRKDPVFGCESSTGTPGLNFECTINYEDGTYEKIYSDEKWDVKIRKNYVSCDETDFTLNEDEFTKAKYIDVQTEIYPSPIPNLKEEIIKSNMEDLYICQSRLQGIFEVSFEKAWSGYVCFDVEGDEYEITICTCEKQSSVQTKEVLKGKGKLSFKSLNLQSVAYAILHVKNLGESDVVISNVCVSYIHYPIERMAVFNTSDDGLNKIYNLCVHNLSVCRQTYHMNSPVRKDSLGCVGDCYIGSLMSYMVFGEYKLSRFDILRIGDYLKLSKGTMFYPSYSLMWLTMVWDYYMFTGDKDIFEYTEEARENLDSLFKSYLGADGVIEKAPNFMFLDMVDIDGFTLHHPPKALGQSALTAFYIHFLDLEEKIADIYGETQQRTAFKKRALQARKAFNDRFLDISRGLYKGGLTNVSKMPVNELNPENVNKKYYTRHANILAVLYDIAPKDLQEDIAVKVMTDPELGPIQPYFMHFMIDMVWKTGLFEEYGLELIHKWDNMVQDNPKGLAEGWGDFIGDYSHAIGGTPAYQLPRAFLGLEMIKPGFEEISLSPNLYGLDFVQVSIPTPYGDIECEMRKGTPVKLNVPEQIKYTLK